jgi:parvulin-like peptidyl-prolyl isomerase
MPSVVQIPHSHADAPDPWLDPAVPQGSDPSAAFLNQLACYQLLPQWQREQVIDRAIATFYLSAADATTALAQFCQQHKLTSDTEIAAWREHYRVTAEQFTAIAQRHFKLQQFKRQTWDARVEAHFFQHKHRYDRAIYSLIRTRDPGIAQELYFRLLAQEQSFADLARDYSQGSEAQTGGKVGPVELSSLHPTLAKLLGTRPAGQVWPPLVLGEWVVLVQLEQFIAAELDAPLRQRILDELFDHWLREQLAASTPSSAD